MLTKYIEAAMHRATYELLEDGTFYGKILDCQGASANAETLSACRDELQEVYGSFVLQKTLNQRPRTLTTDKYEI